MAAADRPAHEFSMRPNDRPKDKALAGSLLQARLGFLDGWISLDRDFENLFQSNGAGGGP
jgi:hypothetical protein